jgi:integrase/recombinase XerD
MVRFQYCRQCSQISVCRIHGKRLALKKIPYAKKPKTKPVILSLEEVCSFIKTLVNLKHRVLVMLAYSTGMRISEVLHLRICDIDSKRMMIRVEQGKWQKDRCR